MTADPQHLRFFVDETSLGLGKTLAMARKDVVHTGHPLVPEIPLGALDTLWMPVVASRGLIVISRDRHIRTKPAEISLLKDVGLRVFWIAGKRDISTWDAVARLVRRWGDIESTVAAAGVGSWFMAINERTIAPIPLEPSP